MLFSPDIISNLKKIFLIDLASPKLKILIRKNILQSSCNTISQIVFHMAKVPQNTLEEKTGSHKQTYLGKRIY